MWVASSSKRFKGLRLTISLRNKPYKVPLILANKEFDDKNPTQFRTIDHCVTYSLDSRENIKGETINLVVDPFPEVNKEKNPESKTRREKKKKKYQNKLSALIKGLNPSAYIDKSITNQFMSVGSEI